MKTDNFTYSFESSKTAEQVFEILKDVNQWWTGFYEETIDGKSGSVNDEFTFHAGGGMHYSKQKLTELVPNKKIVWLVTESALTFLSDPAEWTGSTFGFDISNEGNKTKIKFTHNGLTPEIECFDACSSGWTNYLGSLKEKLK